MNLSQESIGIIGVGFMGGSLVRALLALPVPPAVIGLESRPEYQEILQTWPGLTLATNLDDLARNSSIIVLATGIGAMPAVMDQLAPHLSAGQVVTDLGSIKGAVLSAAKQSLPSEIAFVPAHPIAGDTACGPAHARKGLFKDHWCIICPSKDEGANTRVRNLWESVGMKVAEMTAEQHDATLALTSHLPHVLSFAAMLAARDREQELGTEMTPYSAGSFRDLVRVAGSNPEIWPDILIGNKDALLDTLRALQVRIDEQVGFLEAGDDQGYAAFIRESERQYSRWKASTKP